MKRGESVKVAILLLTSLVASSHAYNQGAPSVSCENMTPGHQGSSPQTTPSPYKIVLQNTHTNLNRPLSIALTSTSGRDEFKGFLIQVRMAHPSDESQKDKPFGDFIEDGGSNAAGGVKLARALACDGIPNNAITHNSNVPKKSVTVEWAPKTPGHYRVHFTVAKDKATYWVNQIHDQVIEVGASGPAQTEYDWKKLCSDLKLNASLEPVEATTPYQVKLESFAGGSDKYKVYQKEKIWINVTSEYGTPIGKMFVQVRKPNDDSKSFGNFILPQGQPAEYHYQIVDCFGATGNAILFVNQKHSHASTSDVSLIWKAPQDELGDFKVVGSILSDESTFWDVIDEHHEVTKITVLKSTGTRSTPTPSATTSSAIPASSKSKSQTTSLNPQKASTSHSHTTSAATQLSLFALSLLLLV